MKQAGLIIGFIVAETLIQGTTEGYFARTHDESAFWGYISFSISAVLFLVAAWLVASRERSVGAGVKVGFGLWIYAALLSVTLHFINSHMAVAGRLPLSMESKGYILSLILLSPIVFAACWIAARFGLAQRS